MTVIEGSDDSEARRPTGSGGRGSLTCAGSKALPQHEIDAQITREKMARLRALRLAQEATNPSQPAKRAASGKRASPGKKSADKPSGRSVSLSDWLATQDKHGRRN
jgi:hypothetical protein